MMLYDKKIEVGETTFHLKYSLLIHSAEEGEIYGVSIEKNDASGNKEEESVEGLFENREKAEQFLGKLASGFVFPVHLTALCHDFISSEEFRK